MAIETSYRRTAIYPTAASANRSTGGTMRLASANAFDGFTGFSPAPSNHLFSNLPSPRTAQGILALQRATLPWFERNKRINDIQFNQAFNNFFNAPQIGSRRDTLNNWVDQLYEDPTGGLLLEEDPLSSYFGGDGDSDFNFRRKRNQPKFNLDLGADFDIVG